MLTISQVLLRPVCLTTIFIKLLYLTDFWLVHSLIDQSLAVDKPQVHVGYFWLPSSLMASLAYPSSHQSPSAIGSQQVKLFIRQPHQAGQKLALNVGSGFATDHKRSVNVTSCFLLLHPLGSQHVYDGLFLDLDSLVLQSRNTYCRGGNPILTVTGINVTWYADMAKKTKLAEGNTYHSPPLDHTTTFYLTQTLLGVETIPQPIIIEIVEPLLVNIVTTPASCGKNDGIISITATGGTSRNPLRYSLNNGPLQTSPVFVNLSPGRYTVNDDIAGCYGSTDVSVGQQESPTIRSLALVDPHCGNADGTLTIDALGGSGSLSYSLNGTDYSSSNRYTYLSGGDYRVMVKDQAGCVISQNASLKKTNKLQFVTVDGQPTSCGQANGRIEMKSTPSNGPVTYSLDGLQTNLSGVFENLPAKTYVLTVRDETGCMDTAQVLVGSSVGPAIGHIQQAVPACSVLEGQLIIFATGTSKLMYSLNGSAYQSDSTFGQLARGTYKVAIKDQQDCIVDQVVQLGEPCQEMVYLPDSFSPNGDGLNEGWSIFVPNPSTYLDDLRIFNRWGEVIFYREPHQLTSGEILWNGIYKDQIQYGLYGYQLRVRFSNGITQVYRGTIFLFRD